MPDETDATETDRNETTAAETTETDETDATETDRRSVLKHTPGRGRTPAPRAVDPSAPEEFGLVQVWWGDGKGKTTAAMGMGFRAAGHGYRVHMLQFMKGGASSVEDVRGEYNAIEAFPGFTYENLGDYGWHGLPDGTHDDDHAAKARAGFERARELVAAAADATGPIPFDAPPEDGCHLLVLDEILYAANRDLVDPADLVDLVESKPEHLELVLTGGHERPAYVYEHADLVSRVTAERHPFEEGQRARKGTEY
ncbi:MAG: cob(I)yrinic acid a,c-diamide adenosyltransferase [Halobacteriota archaeon]